jgi:hypothetical protein
MHPVEYYLGLPFARIADMWLRPRTELLPVASDWWHVSEHPGDSAVAFALGAWNLALIVLALVGAWRIRKAVDREFFWILVAFVVVRSAFLGTLENPEPRYTLECFPFVLALAGAALAFGKKQMRV